MAWHLDGMTYDRYRLLTWQERAVLHEELGDLIQLTTPDSPDDDGDAPIRPKRMRR